MSRLEDTKWHAFESLYKTKEVLNELNKKRSYHEKPLLSEDEKSEIENKSSAFKLSDMHCTVEPLISIIPLLVANSTALSICVILFVFIQTSRVTGCRAEYDPVFDTSKAHTPSDVKA